MVLLILEELNRIHKQIEFTAEKEENGEINFLDCMCYRDQENKVQTKVYKKPTHTGQYGNYNSNQPYWVKISTIKTLVNRAKSICTTEKDFELELKYIKNIIKLNDFPSNVIDKVIHETLNNTHHNNDNKRENNENEIIMHIPYERGISEKISRKAKRFGITTRFTKTKSLKSILNIEEYDKWSSTGVIYKVNCQDDCDKIYIGETGRTLEKRIKEHQADSKKLPSENMSGLSKHAIEVGHQPKWKEVNIICKENNIVKRKWKEAAFILRNKDYLLNKKEEIKNLSSIWEPII